jgi:hypothetical protein
MISSNHLCVVASRMDAGYRDLMIVFEPSSIYRRRETPLRLSASRVRHGIGCEFPPTARGCFREINTDNTDPIAICGRAFTPRGC